MLTCREVSDRASLYLDGGLRWHQRIGFRAHLVMCKACARSMDQLARTLTVLRAAEPAPSAAATEDSILQRLAILRRGSGVDHVDQEQSDRS
jgi:predicted anti-sigma-YlaC factor YlaD